MKLITRQVALVKVVAVAVVSIVLLSACATLPRSGAIGTGEATAAPKNNEAAVNFDPPGPQEGALPEEIVQGFINAASGAADNFKVARTYLTSKADDVWRSGDVTVVYSDVMIGGISEGSQVEVKAKVRGIVDSRGVFSAQDAGKMETITYRLTQDSGQWRIDEAPPLLLIEKSTFSVVFSNRALYFFDPTYEYLVPDVRWFAHRRSQGEGDPIATAMVQALLDGPASYLRGAVVSAFPENMRLLQESVPVQNGRAIVDVNAKLLTDATALQQQQMQAQINATLARESNTISAVQLRADRKPVTIENPESERRSYTPPRVPTRQVGISQGDLVWFEDNKVVPARWPSGVSGLGLSKPALDYQGKEVAFLAEGDTALYTVSADQPPERQLTGVGLTPPSYDLGGRAWAAATDGSGRVISVAGRDSQRTATLTIDWLKDRTVSALRISRDGTRALIISSAGGVSKVQVAGILRTDNTISSLPKTFNQPTELLVPGQVSQGYWLSERSVALIRTVENGAVTMVEQDVAGTDPQNWPDLPGVRKLSVGNDRTQVYALTNSGEIYSRSSGYWNVIPLAADVTDLAYSG